MVAIQKKVASKEKKKKVGKRKSSEALSCVGAQIDAPLENQLSRTPHTHILCRNSKSFLNFAPCVMQLASIGPLSVPVYLPRLQLI